MTEIVNLISNVGFPMAMTLIMMWYIYDSNRCYEKRIQEITESHRAEMESALNVIQQNTAAIDRLTDSLERMSYENK